LADTWLTLEKRGKKEEREHVDEWIAGQFKWKNWNLCKETAGIIVSDRCPLDPLAFTKRRNWSKKADYLLSEVPDLGFSPAISEGHVILLIDDEKALDLRVRRTNKKYRKKDLKEMQEILKQIYDVSGATPLDIRFESFAQIMKRVCRIVHLEEYQPADIYGRLVAIKEGQS
jgi:hypothetical protein